MALLLFYIINFLLSTLSISITNEKEQYRREVQLLSLHWLFYWYKILWKFFSFFKTYHI